MNRKAKTLIGINFFVVLCLSIGGLSGFITQAAIPTWYTGLEKPFLRHLIGFLLQFGPHFIV